MGRATNLKLRATTSPVDTPLCWRATNPETASTRWMRCVAYRDDGYRKVSRGCEL